MTGGQPGDDLVGHYDLVIFDLDGVLYLVDQVIPGAAEACAKLRERGIPSAYATNNASRLPGDVAALLTRIGIPAEEREVVTSAHATALLLAERFEPGTPVLVLGAQALRDEVAAAGLTPVAEAERARVVVQGYGPDVRMRDLGDAAVAIRGGATWIATNADRTLPSPRGPLPGNGALVAALATALGRPPDTIVGKPDPALFLESARERGAQRPLVVGDRLDTDIEGAYRAGMDSLFVLTGVSDAAELLAAPVERRPTFVAADLAGLFEPARGVPTEDQWVVSERPGQWELAGDGRPVDALLALCQVAWAAGEVRPVVAQGEAARAALQWLRLT
ncbi:HAD-IIA family hydrolase [Dactylosporangium vinaceum]|uniref:HAD-IIA family hydrolase n=1 Tax=Dactylosporangium vinaceum TaxID=53362 RepID=A0ABV5MPE2_9ACTN|nr:HAD-IIA family hydrolase [Dactylosporangium vinaceum]UAB94571.1 HAD-IIA family hydrolase [Dactylosporangium vinaceum]